MDQVLPAMEKSRELLQENRNLLQENHALLRENHTLLRENHALLLENRSMLLAIIKHLEVPYQPKRPMGFNIEPRPKD